MRNVILIKTFLKALVTNSSTHKLNTKPYLHNTNKGKQLLHQYKARRLKPLRRSENDILHCVTNYRLCLRNYTHWNNSIQLKSESTEDRTSINIIRWSINLLEMLVLVWPKHHVKENIWLHIFWEALFQI